MVFVVFAALIKKGDGDTDVQAHGSEINSCIYSSSVNKACFSKRTKAAAVHSYLSTALCSE